MSVPTLLVIVALVLALVDELQSQGKSLLGWSVILVCAALLWGHIG